MKPTYTLLLIISVFLLPCITSAQSNYQPGYVINLQGDTIRGYIDYRGWDSNPTSVSLKSAVADVKPQRFTINDIQFFNVTGITSYQKFTCQVSMDDINTLRLTSGRDTSFQTETVFLQVLEKGKNVALYAYADRLKTRYYIGETPGYTPAELVYRIYYGAEDGTTKQGNTSIENTYLKQLFAIANKDNVLDDDLTKRLNSAGYNKDDLLVIVSKINGISKAEYAKKYADHSQYSVFLSAALNVSNTTSNASSAYTAGGGTSHTSYGPAVSLGFNLIPNAVTHKIEFRAEIAVAETQFSSIYQLKVSPYVGSKASFNQLGISIAPQVIYNFYNSGNTKAYLGFGIIFTYFTYSNSFFGSQNPGVSDQGIGAADPYDFNTYDNSFLLTAGVKFNRNFGAFFKYVAITPVTRGGYFQLSNALEQVGIAYFIGK